MQIKKKIATVLACLMLINTTSVLGNAQKKLPADGIDPVVVSHTNASEAVDADILPSASVTFKRALENDSNTSTERDDNYQQWAEFYQLILEDSLGNKITGKKMESKDKAGETLYNVYVENNLEDASKFESGRLYKLMVKPGHYHVDSEGNRTVVAPESALGEHPSRYFVTDFNTIAREADDKVEILWEYIPGASYKLVYIDRDVDTKDAVDGNDTSGGPQSGVGSTTIRLNESNITTVTENGIKKVKYTLEDTLPGQKYSAYVVVEGISHSFLKESFGNVGKNTETPKIARIARSVKLTIDNIGRNRIQLNWTLGSWADSKLTMTRIWRKTEGDRAYTQIGTIINSKDIGKFEHDEPSKNSYYYIEFVLSDGSILKTEEVLYVPYALREQPLKPQVPIPYSDSLKTEVGFSKNNYLVKNDDISIDKMKDNTFHVKRISPLNLQLVWDAPTKKAEDGMYTIDYDLGYDIWVVEEEAMLGDKEIKPIIQNLKIPAGDLEHLIKKQDGKTVVGFKNILTQYTTVEGVNQALLSNHTYYIKIVAKRDYSGVSSVSMPTVVAITIDKNGDIFAPPVLAKPPLRVQKDGVTDKSITMEWLEKWYEISANNPEDYTDEDESFFAKLWNSVVYTGGTPAIKFKSETGLKEHILKTQDDVTVVKKTIGETTYVNQYKDRAVTLGKDVKYEVKPLLYDDVLRQIKAENINITITTDSMLTLEKWIVENESDTESGWQTIAPGTINHADGLTWKQHTMANLLPNTRYILLVRAYRELDNGKKLQQTFPSYVIATTLSDYEAPEADPTVPVLSPDGVTDESVAVWWTYNEDFDYEIVYSRLEDPNKATSWEFKVSSVPGEKNYIANGTKASVTITGLMPDTTYNVWIRAKQKKGDKISRWSNPVTQTTKTIGTPDVPRGLGPAAYQSILEIGQDFKAIGKDYITVEWIKNIDDLETSTGNEKGRKAYSYVLEFADNPEFLDATTVVVDNESVGKKETGYEILAKNMVKFTGLVSNRPYYVKIKAVLTFTDEEVKREIITESEFTNWVRILTKKSDDEYDGGDNENVVTYPEAIVESYSNNVWTWEIVDTAKIISGILKQKQYFYTINVERYNKKYDAEVRRIRIPKSVMDTLINQNMELKIVTSSGTYEIPAKAMGYAVEKYSAKDMVQLEFTRAIDYKFMSILRPYPEKLLKGEKLDITIKSSSKSLAVKSLDGYLKVKLKLDASQEYLYKSIFAYTYNYDKAAWEKETYALDAGDETYITYKAAYTGLYTAYENQKTASLTNASYTMTKLGSAYNINGLGNVYFKKDVVYRDQYINLILGLAQKEESIDLTAAVSSRNLEKAKAAGVYVGSGAGAITQEQALMGIIKLYELKNGYKIKASKVKFANVGAAYQESVGKAYAIGLIEDVNAKQTVTFDQLAEWLWQIVE